jgi:ppGpp synthetase/RelA/SpoT-type nucleotidyltranferase
MAHADSTTPGDYAAHIDRFVRERPQYAQLAVCLTKVLEEGAGQLGLHPIVQARAKTVASFAEKIIRKGYVDPFQQMTDLCGGRVILHTLRDVAAMDRFIDESFHVFPEDSEDKQDRLKASEFGYLSRHYVVTFKPGVFPESVVPAALLPLKAELQVRTMLQHAWADIAHELSYKNRFKLPRKWEREFARLAALLEEADKAFDGISVGLEEYATSYDKSLPADQVRKEIANCELVLTADAKNADIAHRLAKLAMVLGEWERAIAVLQPFAEDGPAPLLRDLGVSICKRHRAAPFSDGYTQGQAMLQRSIDKDPDDVDAWASLGGTWRVKEKAAPAPALRAESRRQAREHYRRAYLMDPSDPFPLGNFIEYELAEHPQLDIASFFEPALEAAGRRCALQIAVGVNLPWAYFDLGKFHLLRRRPYAALGHYAAGIADSSSAFPLESALGSFDTLEVARATLPGFDWSREFLRAAKAFRFDKALASESTIAAPVLIVAGFCDRSATQEELSALKAALRGWSGTLISGGTTAGVSGLIGDLRAELGSLVHTIGYSPGTLPDDVQLDSRYREQRRTAGTDFSPLEPIQYWRDLHAAGVERSKIKLLALGGGAITACECQMALALAVPVGLIGVSNKAFAEAPWSDHAQLQRLPLEEAAVRRFLEQ